MDESFDFQGLFDDPVIGPIVRAHRARLSTFAEKHGLAVLAARLPSPGSLDNQSLDNLLTALAEFASESGHAELAGAPIVFDGYSMGGCYAYAFARRHPERVIGFISQKGGCHVGLGGPVTAVPGYFFIGDRDLERRCINITETFEGGRPNGAIWTLAVQPGADHSRVVDFDLLFDWMDTVVERRLPEVATPGAPVVLRSISEESGWLGDRETATIAPFDEYERDKAQASWLPSAETAQRWSAFVSPGRALGCPTEDPDGPSMNAGSPAGLRVIPSSGWKTGARR